MNLSPNFTLDELTVSQVAERRGVANQPPAWMIPELMRLAQTVLQPLRDELARPVVVTSGYRSSAVNTLVGGAANSDHTHGHAADIIVPGMLPGEVARTIVDLALPFKQCIVEFGRWVHVSIEVDGHSPRREALTASIGPGGVVRYRHGIA